MSRTVFYTATTLDGFIADEHDSLSWLFKQDIDDTGPFNFNDLRAGLGAGCMGATTYEWILGQEPDAWDDSLPTWVFTHRDLPSRPGVTFVSGDVTPVHAEMVAAAGEKDIWVVGGGDLAAQFAEAGLLDEVVVSIAPVTLGSGRPLFPRRFDLALVEHARNRDFLCARYDVVGPLPAG